MSACYAESESKEESADFFGSVGDFLGNAWNDVGQFAKDQWNNLSGMATTTWASITETAGNAWLGASETVNGVWDNVTGAFIPTKEETDDAVSTNTHGTTINPDEQIFFLGTAINTGKDNGYSGSNEILISDPHYGWTLGRFYITGFTRAIPDDDGNVVFLKTLGDKIALHFELYQDINHLNGGKNMSISEDKDGYDQYFGIGKTNFGKGALIVKHTNFQNYDKTPVLYTDFLAARATDTADNTVELFEEGDYEVALDYEINKPKALNMPSYNNYRVYFKFSVRNGNCMVFPFDIKTREELTNTAITENGFYLDLAKSRYLDINVKKETLNPGMDALVEDTRFNSPAKDGKQYTDEGIYTITVSNRYTGSTTVKKIFVGSSEVLKKYSDSGMVIGE